MVRLLCENPWNGGGGYTPEQVGRMTPDQAYMRLCEHGLLKEERTQVIHSVPAASESEPGKEGMVKGRLADGSVVWLPMRRKGKTQAQLDQERSVRNGYGNGESVDSSQS